MASVMAIVKGEIWEKCLRYIECQGVWGMSSTVVNVRVTARVIGTLR